MRAVDAILPAPNADAGRARRATNTMHGKRTEIGGVKEGIFVKGRGMEC